MLVKKPNTRIKQCKKCLFYGHVEKWCKSEKRKCNICSSQDHGTSQCDSTKFCFHCKSAEHNPTFVNCLERTKQKNISEIMVTNNISFAETCQVYNGTDIIHNRQTTLWDSLQEFPDALGQNDAQDLLLRSPPSKLTRRPFAQVVQRKSIPPVQPSQRPTNFYRKNRDFDRPMNKRKLDSLEGTSRANNQTEDFMIPLRRTPDP